MDESPDEELLEFRFVVPADRDGWRLDRFLHDRIPRLSRTRLQRIISEEVVRPDGEAFKPSHRVRFGDVITLLRPPAVEPDVPLTFGVLHEDDDLFIIDKPAGLPVHPTARFHRHTLTWLLRERFGEGRPVIAHRLDRETSGVLVCARHRGAERHLKLQFERRALDKEYLAIVTGRPEFETRTVDAPIGPAVGSEVKIRMGIRRDAKGLPAKTVFRVVERLGDRALVAAKPLTGRQHQIRAHLAHIGHPVVGDKIYGPDERLFITYVESELSDDDWRRLELPRHALHAHRITIEHPGTGASFTARSPLPADLVRYLVARRERAGG